jgi:hypothetical protein
MLGSGFGGVAVLESPRFLEATPEPRSESKCSKPIGSESDSVALHFDLWLPPYLE